MNNKSSGPGDCIFLTGEKGVEESRRRCKESSAGSRAGDYGKRRFKAAVLSLSLLTIMAGAGVAPGLEKIMAAFPQTPQVAVKLIISVPSLLMVLSSLLVGMAGERISRRAMILAGLSLFIAGGAGAGLMNSLEEILFFRAVLGLGAGIILAFSTGLIAACYAGEEKKRMMGYSFALNCAGAVAGNIMAGILASISWRHMFLIYLIGLLSLFPVLLFLKDLPGPGGRAKTDAKIQRNVFVVAFFAMIAMMVFYLVAANLSVIVKEHGIGDSQTTGYLFALASLSMLAGGLLLPIASRMRQVFLPGVFVLMAAGLSGVSASYDLDSMLPSIASFGIGLGLFYPYLLNTVSGKLAPDQAVKSMSVVMASAWMGQFLSPLFFSFISSLTGSGTEELFLYSGGVFFAAAAAMTSYSFVVRKRRYP
jgi:MFS family permease